MARAARHITIEGQFAYGVLGTFRIIRGFATLQDLAAISAPATVTHAGQSTTQRWWPVRVRATQRSRLRIANYACENPAR